MAHIMTLPAGVVPQLGSLRQKPIIKVISGDSWSFTVSLYDPIDPSLAADPLKTYADITLAETQFDKPLWTGYWYSGIFQDDKRSDLFHIRIPEEITRSLRRGSYMFSIRVSDLLKTRFVTEVEGSFLVEYKPTSEQHSIPYKDNTGENTVDDAEKLTYPRHKGD